MLIVGSNGWWGVMRHEVKDLGELIGKQNFTAMLSSQKALLDHLIKKKVFNGS